MREIPGTHWVLIWLPVQIVSLVMTTFLFTFGLILVPFVVYLLALGVTAIFVSLTAVLAGNLLIKDDLRSSMGGVLLHTEIAALILAMILIVMYYAGINLTPAIWSSILPAVILAVIATYAAITLRVPSEQQPHQIRRALLWTVVALVSVPVTIAIASLFGWAGA